jgi:D-glycero-alpha-D-manno-heptose-7-phosphate kinase
MIVTRTPFRITLGGGGTDLPAYYEQHGGYVLALGIDKYMYVMLNAPYADRKVRLHYSQSEVVDDVRDLRHELAREGLLRHDIRQAIEVSSLADLPAGTGLGSSSSYLVGLLAAVRAFKKTPASAAELANEACIIELQQLKKLIGKQDQYMAAFGGLSELLITKNGQVTVQPIDIPGYAVNHLVANTHLYYTNVQRSATDILDEQSANARIPASETGRAMREIHDIGQAIGRAITQSKFDEFGRLMHEHWLAKKRASKKVSLPIVEDLYEHVRSNFGVLGGKIVGAGGGGFLMLYTPAGGESLTEFMRGRGMARLTYAAEYEGAKILANTMSSRPGAELFSSERPIKVT